LQLADLPVEVSEAALALLYEGVRPAPLGAGGVLLLDSLPTLGPLELFVGVLTLGAKGLQLALRPPLLKLQAASFSPALA